MSIEEFKQLYENYLTAINRDEDDPDYREDCDECENAMDALIEAIPALIADIEARMERIANILIESLQ